MSNKEENAPSSKNHGGRDVDNKNYPEVIAAGYFQFHSPKTGLKFPAFLVKLSDNNVDGCWKWKVKGDFLSLSRSFNECTCSKYTTSTGTTSTGITSTNHPKSRQFPKSSFRKLSQSASSSPWIKTNYNHICNNDTDNTSVTICNQNNNYHLHDTDDLRNTTTKTSTNSSTTRNYPSVIIHQMMIEKQHHSAQLPAPISVVDNILMHHNSYSKRMDKSILQLNQFLHSCSTHPCDPVTSAWHQFCYGPPSPHLIVNHSLLQPTASLSTSTTLIHSSQKQQHAPDEELESDIIPELQRASKYGQYFCTPNNAQTVCQLTFQHILQNYHHNDNSNHTDILDWSNIIFVEPSCGDGKILIQLCITLATYIFQQYTCNTSSIHPTTRSLSSLMKDLKFPRIIGYDIDSKCISRFKENISKQIHELVKPNSCSSNNTPRKDVFDDTMHNIQTPYQECYILEQLYKNIIIRCRNFLHLTREDLMQDASTSYTNTTATANTNTCTNDMKLLFLGGPPYTNGAGNGSLITKDLPYQFVKHCIVHLKCHFISFILPKRFRNDIQQIKDEIKSIFHAADSETHKKNNNKKNELVSSTGSTNSNDNDDENCGVDWDCMVTELEESNFYFGTNEDNQKIVNQPSCVFTWAPCSPSSKCFQ